MSGAEWQTLTDEQKQPYIRRAALDKERVRQQYLTQHPEPTSSHTDNDVKQNSTDSTVVTNAAEDSSEERKADESVVKDERKEAMEKVEAVQEEFSELSPALSSRRPSDPFVQALAVPAEPTGGRRAVPLNDTPFESPRPGSAMQLYINDSVERAMEEARSKGTKLLKGDARKAARLQWDQMMDAEQKVSSNSNLTLIAEHCAPLLNTLPSAAVCCVGLL